MSRSIFGWSYPPGAENDPNAPYNQPDPVPCKRCKGTGKLTDPDAEDPEDREFKCDGCEGAGEVDPRYVEDGDPDADRECFDEPDPADSD
jgi:hypothetical protein